MHQVVGEPWGMFRYPPRNLGTLRCFDELLVEVSPALRPNLPHEIFLDDPSAGSLTITRFTPSEWRAHVDLTRDTDVVLNQNYFRGWSVSGGALAPRRGLVSARVAAGSHDIAFVYRPRGWIVGSLLSWTMIALTAALLVRERRRATRVAPAHANGTKPDTRA
jgi:hypothetical protein